MMVSSNALQRTLCIKRGDNVGTAFTVDRDARQYIVTARHVVDDIAPDDSIAVRYQRRWVEVPVILVGLGAGETDVAVLAHAVPLTPSHPLEAGARTDWFHGQSVAFLGFPFGWDSGLENINNGFPIPFVKAGIISASVPGTPSRIYIDAHGNPGFSGGPLVFCPPDQPRMFHVAGVVVDSPRDPITAEQTGFVRAIDIQHVVSLIDANPVGASYLLEQPTDPERQTFRSGRLDQS